MKVIDILERVTTLYNDKEYVRVPESHYLKFLDDALNQLVLSRPDSHVKTEIVKLKKGTRQEIPSDGYTLIDIYMNKKLVTPADVILDDEGNIIEEIPAVYSNFYPVAHVQREDLDYFSNWQSQGNTLSKDYINEFAFDIRTPRVFWVNPFVNNKDVYVEMDYSYGFTKYGELPKDEDDTWTTVEQMDVDTSEVFLGPIVSYMLYLLYSTDSTSQLDRQNAATYLQSFYQALGIEYQANQQTIPRTESAELEASLRQKEGSSNG